VTRLRHPPSQSFGVTRGYGVASPPYPGDGVASGLMNSENLSEFAKRYAKAWCSQNPDSVAAFFAERGSISINNGPPAIGRVAIAREAQAFMTTFPDMVVTFDKLEPRGNRTAFHWTLIGTNTGSGGTGNRVRISGYELWKIDNDGLIAESKGNFDAAEYERQLKNK
jgi:predicted ester cyclase